MNTPTGSPIQSPPSAAASVEDVALINPFTIPFAGFLLVMMGGQLIASLKLPGFAFEHPEFWVYPLQILVCAVLLLRGWKQTELKAPKQLWLTFALAILVLGIWIAPQALFGAPRRENGFNPTLFESGSSLYWITVLLRFVRLAVIVPFVEELFWRGFLLRTLINERFKAVPIGAFSWMSFGGVSVAFMLEHAPVDYPAALIAGALYNLVAIRSRSLSSCVLAHAITNFLLGLYVMHTRQWGFW